MKTCLELAVYGKGGIGKSTVSANLSAALAGSGKRVMQIGCDPKHDSTRLLMHGENIPTVLEYLRDVDPEHAHLKDVLKTGYLGVGCIEAGGPKPGVGCAGRGIISSFEFLNRKKAKEDYDLVLYDVLGDVVCGGFAVPVRREYADAIFLVTSGEYMALYAANNILRGIQNYDGDVHRRVAGIIFNERKVTDEDGRVERFARAVGLPICVKVPRSNAFAKAEEANKTLMEMEGCEKEKDAFRKLTAMINGDLQLHLAKPLSDERLEEVVLQTGRIEELEERTGSKEEAQSNIEEATLDETVNNTGALKENFAQQPGKNRQPLYGCAFNGAASSAIMLRDAIIIAHSPKACAYYSWQNMTSPGRKNLFNRGVLLPSSISPHFECTDMDDGDVVFGGMDRLRKAVERAIAKKPGAVIVISSCVSGIIGDDIRSLEEMSTDEVQVVTVPADGDIAGDYMEGIRLCREKIAEHLIDKHVTVDSRKKAINLIGETGVSVNRDANYRILSHWMDALSIEINCRFLGETTAAQIRHFLEAPWNILASDTGDSRVLKQWLTETYHVNFIDGALPIGFAETKSWLLRMGELFDAKEQADTLIAREEQEYRKQISELRPLLAGKKVFLTTINANMDWLLDTMKDLGMEVVFIGVLNYLYQEVHVTDHPENYHIDTNFNGDRTDKVLEEQRPDLVLANYVTQEETQEFVVDAMPMSPLIGFDAGIHFARRWVTLFEQKKMRKGGWSNDRHFYEKYFA